MELPARKTRKFRFKFRSIQTKLTLAIILILIPVTALLSILSFRNSQTIVKDRIFEQLETVITNRQDRINEVITDSLNYAERLTSNVNLQSAIQEAKQPNELNRERLRMILEETLGFYPDLKGVMIISPEGTVSASTGTSDYIDILRRVLKEFAKKNEFTLFEDNKYFFITGPILADGKIIGRLLAVIEEERMDAILRDYTGLGRTGEIGLGKRDGEDIVYINKLRNQSNPDQQLRLKIKDSPRLPVILAVQSLSGIETFTDYRNVGVIAAYRHIPSTGWGLVAKIDTEEAFAPIETLKREMMQISLLTLLLFLFVAFVVSRSITEPLHQLHVGTEKIAKGEWDYKLNVKTGDEVEQLAIEFTRMAQELKALYEGLEQKVRDRTSQLEQEKSISENLANDLKKFQLAVENASDQIIITDPDANIIYANKTIERLTGFTKDEVIGKNPGKMWGGQMDKKFYKKMWEIIKIKKETFRGEFTNKKKNGEKYIAAISITPIFDSEGNISFFVGIERDITHEKEVDRMKTEFISLASHQLRTPLSAIKWFTEMLLAGDAGELGAEQKEFIEQVYGSNERMIELVNALLNVSRIEQGRMAIEPKPTDLIELVNQVLMELRPKIEAKNHKVKVNKEGEIPQISIDPKLIRQVYANLISNSVRYTPEKGEIDVVISRKGEDLVSQISDTGRGIPRELQRRVFTKFFRGENILDISPEGTGLGLYIAKSVVESSGGKIWFESEEGKGTKFWFTLPVKGTQPRKGDRTLEEVKL